MNTIFFHGPLAVTLDPNGRVLAIEDRATGKIPSLVYSEAFIQSAVNRAILAFDSLCDYA